MLKNTVIFIIALLGFGMIRLPLQERILEQEKNAGLLEEPVNLSRSRTSRRSFFTPSTLRRCRTR